MEEKVFKTFDELVDILIRRGIHISGDTERDYAKNILERTGYYNLINGYSDLFWDTENTADDPVYKQGTTLKEIVALYKFDRTLRNIFFRYILSVETQIKSLIAYYFSEAHGHKNFLIYSNFNMALSDSSSNVPKLISEIQRQISAYSKDPSISHYMHKHGYVPLWVLNNILTLGTISKFYSLMLPSERQSVSRHFNMLDNELENSLMYISNIRNFCAHGNRLYCYRTIRPLSNTSYHSSLNIQTNPSGEFLNGKRDLFACLIALKRLLPDTDFKKMSKEIFRAVRYLEDDLKVITKEDVLNKMGFPNNWRELNSL